MKKRVLSLFLAVMMLLLLVMPGVSAATYEDSLHVITSLGYVEENAEDHPITRGEASEMLVKLMELGYTANGETPLPFGDVPATHPYYQAIASGLQLGMVSSDTEFRPDDVITYAEMAKMIVCLLGHAEPALDLGGYPAGFALMAQRLGINDGVSGVTDAQLSSHEATIMLYNTFCANVKEPVRFTAADGGVFYNETHKLYQYLGYELAEGIVVANDLTSLNTADELDEGTVAITSMDEIYRVGETDIDAYLGYKVRAFYKEDASGYKEIKTFYTAPETKVLTLGYEATPFAYLEGERILIDYYKDNGKLTNIVTSAKTVIVNGVCSSTVTNESLDAMFGDFKGGTLTLIGNTTGSGYDVVKVDKPVSGLVTRVDATNRKIYYKDYAIPGHEMEVILDEDTNLKVYTPDGKLTELANVTPGVVISVYASENKKYARIYTSTTVVEGTLTVINPDGKYYIDGKAYEKLETIPDSVMKLGVKSRFYLNKEGFIAGLDTDNVNYSYYGLLMNASTNGGEYIQVLTSAGELKTLECEERIYAFDGTAVTKVDFSSLICYTEVDKGYGNVPKHMLWYTRNAKNFTYDTNNYSSTDTQFYWRPGLSEQDKSNAASRKPIYYELNDKGKVRKIIVPDIGGEDNKISSMNVIDGTNHTFWAPRSANLSISNSTSATTYRVSSNAIAYSCLARTYDAEDYKYAGAYSYFTDGKSRKFQLYSLEDSGKVDIMVGYDFLPYEAMSMPLVVIESISQGLNDTYGIEGMSAGSEYEATVSGDLTVIERDLYVEQSGSYVPLTASNLLAATTGAKVKDVSVENNKRQTVATANLKPGDIVMLGKDRNDEVSYIEVVMRGDRGVNLATSVGSSYTSRLATSTQIEKGVVTAHVDGQCYVRVVNEYNSKLRRNTVFSTAALTTPFYDETHMVRFSYSGCKIVEMDYATGKVQPADYTSLNVGDVVLYKGTVYNPTNCIILRNNPVEPDYYTYWYEPEQEQPGEDDNTPVRPAEYQIDNKNNYAGVGLTNAWTSSGMIRFAKGTENGIYIKLPFSSLGYNGTLDEIENITLDITFAAAKDTAMGLYAATEAEMGGGTFGTDTATGLPAASAPLTTFDITGASGEQKISIDITQFAKQNLCDNKDLYLFLKRTTNNNDNNMRMHCYSGTGKTGVPMTLKMTYKETELK